MNKPQIDFIEFPKIARLSREIVVTEKIDGTNAQIYIPDPIGEEDGRIYAGSRTKWITPEDDNHGFARWVEQNRDELLKLGPGSHFGEWWGSGIQRGYGLTKGEKRFSLFNVHRWGGASGPLRPKCCDVVPVLHKGAFQMEAIDAALDRLRKHGSVAAPGFMKPEGVVIFHTASGYLFKKTIEKDEQPKGVNR
jgi:hypothetical protein